MIKKIFFALFTIVTLLIIGGLMFQKFSPQFGAAPTSSDIENFRQSKQYDGSIFVNAIPTSLGIEFKSILPTLWEFIKGSPNRSPKNGITVIPASAEQLNKQPIAEQILWFGHSTFLLQIDGLNLLFDPMLSDVPAPHPWLGRSRYSADLPIDADELPELDAILISHDHYDHLDYESILKLHAKTKHFYVPLGVGRHLQSWGIPADKITEMDWWDEQLLEETQISFTPARHFSGRKISGQNKTLWGSWTISGKSKTIFFSGDTGYGPHFKEISKRYGPVDFALLECGQYNEKWADIHMLPEQSIQAAQDLQAKVMMPVHWAAFTLSVHSWTEPAERATIAANNVGQALVIPQIGELIVLANEPKPRMSWWKND